MQSAIVGLIVQIPLAAVVGMALRRVYLDWLEELKNSRQERLAMQNKLDDIDKSIAALANAIENWNTLQRRQRERPIEALDRGF